MAAKTKRKKKQTTSKKKQTTTRLKAKPIARKKIVAKKRKIAKKKVAPKKKVVAKRRRSQATEFPLNNPEVHSGRLSGDLQGLSQVEGAESESVAELLEEGNTFEAEVLSGVEAADATESDDNEVKTHEVPEDDVPGEYLDED